MGLLDEILKQLEEAQQQGQGRPPPRALPPRQRPPPTRPEREADEDGAEWEEDETARPGHAPHIPERRAAAAEAPPAPEPEPARTTADSRPALAPHDRGVASSAHLLAMLRDRPALRDALILREILGPPPGLKRLRRR